MPIELSSYTSIDKIDAAQWNALVDDNHPLLQHAVLLAMETYKSIGPETGWIPRYIAAEEGGKLIGAVPLYEKHNSWGEFVFDHAWADAYQRHGLSYYPKLVAGIPFSPVFGQKLLAVPDRLDEVRQLLMQGCIAVTKQLEASSVHFLFPTTDEQALLVEQGLMARHDCQYHWHNQSYNYFEDFLACLTAKKRKNIRQERSAVVKAGVTVRRLNGVTATSEDWQDFCHFYALTYERKWGQPIFSQAFFESVAQILGERLVLVMGYLEDNAIAAALMYQGDKVLYGRHWGCDRRIDGLHFELCYYQGIEHCIEHGLALFEPGAQGEHKVARGFNPVLTHSAHWVGDERFVPSIRQFCEHEKESVLGHIERVEQHLAYK
ncbi:MAG: putative N-acyltransferase [Saprospiraceae bacterium]|jgi:predicted N-acyltransferase